jgi:hypothetical protein
MLREVCSTTEEKKPPYPTCPSCGSTYFLIDGYVGYVQPYDAKAGEYGLSEMIYEEDIAMGARCAGCEGDVTELFKKFDILAFYKIDLKEK